MINIIEKEPERISGVTSLFVSFNYNPEIVTTIKNAEKYSYNKKTFTWELPVTSLSYLVNNLTYIDDITLQLAKDDSNQVHYIPKLTYKTPCFEHQLQAIEHGLNIDKWLLLDSPGLGKSKTIINLAEELKAQKGLQHCLIICGINTLKTNWASEIEKHSDLSWRILGRKISKKGTISYTTVKERAAELMNPIDEFFTIFNVESLRSDDIIQALKTTKNKFDMVVIDEVHKCSSMKSQQGKNLLKLKNYTFKIGLTGTLLTNTPLNAYLPLRWIDAEKATLTDFKGQYCEFGGFGGHEVVGYKNLDILKDEIDKCSLRRTKDIIKGLPEKTVIKETVELDDTHRKFYDAIKEGIKEECDKIELDSNNVLALTTRLRQATACPSALTTENIVSSKLERAVDLAEEIMSQGEKVVIMATFKESIRELQKMLSEYKPLVISGDLTDEQCNQNRLKFQEDPSVKIIIVSFAKGGTGITLNAASYSILVDTPWTYALTEQAEDRIHRVDNKRPAFIYRLISQNTVDEVVDNIVSVKKALGDYIVDDKQDEGTIQTLKNYILEL